MPSRIFIERVALLNDQASSRVAWDFGSVISRIFPGAFETILYCEEVRSHFRALNLGLSVVLPHGCAHMIGRD